MDAQLNTALVQSFFTQLEERLLNGTYRLNPDNRTYLINNRSMVICIVDGDIGEHRNTSHNVKLAQEFYHSILQFLIVDKSH